MTSLPSGLSDEGSNGPSSSRLLHESAAAEARFRGLIEVAPDAIVTADSDGHIVLVNGQTEALFGYQREELLGQPVELLLPQRYHTEHVGHRSNFTKAPRIRPMGQDLDLFARRKDGTEFPVEISLGPIEVDGELLVIATIRDITERKRLIETMQRQADLIDLANDAIIVLSPNRVVVSWNRGSANLYGWAPDEAVGRVLHDLLEARYPESVRAVDDELMRNGHWDGEIAHTRKGGGEILVDSHQVLIRGQDGSPSGLFEINRDITERRRAEEASEAARREAEEANVAKSEFLSRMSHELRTPLNAILGFGQLLSMDNLEGEQRDSVNHILRAGAHLLELINEVLDISRIEAGRLTLSIEPVMLDTLLRETQDLVRPLAQEHGVRILEAPRPEGLHVLADQQRLRQVLLNLLTNAVKYNRAGGTVNISCTTQDKGITRISIRDSGLGMTGEQVERLFTPFERLDAEQSGVEGTGLGLALSKRLVEVMDGTMGVESIKGEGSTFWIELPQTESALNRELTLVGEQPGALVQAPPAGRTVLYIEDNLASFQLMDRIFSRWSGVKLISAMQGRLGVELAMQHIPDLVLLDLHLPDIHGYEVLQRLRANESTRHIPIIVTSADATAGQIERLRDAGADDYLTKPLDIRRFAEAVRKHLE